MKHAVEQIVRDEFFERNPVRIGFLAAIGAKFSGNRLVTVEAMAVFHQLNIKVLTNAAPYPNRFCTARPE